MRMLPSVAVLVALVSAIATATEEDAPATPDLVTTSHEFPIAGSEFTYDATAGRLTMRDDVGVEKAWIFHVAYVKRGTTDPAKRPLTFAFNGGPGSSSVWLHMGCLGPRRAAMGPEGEAPPPPYRHVANEGSWLPFTDLVFVDPVSTGFSRPAKDQEKEQFHGLHEDADSVADFIRRYLTANG